MNTHEIPKWDYRGQTVGGLWTGVKVDELKQLLNTWDEENWEIVSAHILENANKINIIAKRPLMRETIRQCSMPHYKYQYPTR